MHNHHHYDNGHHTHSRLNWITQTGKSKQTTKLMELTQHNNHWIAFHFISYFPCFFRSFILSFFAFVFFLFIFASSFCWLFALTVKLNNPRFGVECQRGKCFLCSCNRLTIDHSPTRLMRVRRLSVTADVRLSSHNIVCDRNRNEWMNINRFGQAVCWFKHSYFFTPVTVHSSPMTVYNPLICRLCNSMFPVFRIKNH